MKTAILLATRKGDSLAVKFLAHGAFSEVLADFKDRVATDRGEPGFDSLEIWTGPPVKTAQRLSSGDQDIALIVVPEGEAPTPEQFQEIAQAWEEHRARLLKRIEDLETELAELTTKFHGAPPQGEEGLDPQGSLTQDAGEGSEGVSLPGEQGSTQLPDTARASTGEGDLPGAQATDGQLPLTDPPTGETTPGEATAGTMSPRRGGRR